MESLTGCFQFALDHSKLDLEVILHDYMDEWGGESVTDTGHINMGVSENSVPLNPMVLRIIIPIKWLFHWEY